jgi:hypothetical protein
MDFLRHSLIRTGVFAIALVISNLCALAQSTRVPEYQVKATFLFQFAQFVDWPEETLPTPQTPISICTLGQDRFGDSLNDTVRGEKVAEHPLVVRRHTRVEDITNCHLIFVSGSEAGQLDKILSVLKDKNVLTVSDMEKFADRGGMIQFVTEQNRIRLRINLGATKAADLVVSSKILRLATLVGED